MMIFLRYVLPLVSFLSSVLALPLVKRDVVDPPITYPTANTIWHVGQMQTVTWNATGLPTNQSNPVGRLVLGYMYNNSENLMLNSPLATNLSYSTGQVQITVPNVPTREDYIIVLFGDSGNASPEFTIINDASSSTSIPSPATTSPSGSSSADPPAPTPTPPSTSPDPPEDAASSSSHAAGSTSTGGTARATGTASSGQTATNHSSTVTVSATVVPSGQSSAAWQKHAPGLGICLCISLVLVHFVFS